MVQTAVISVTDSMHTDVAPAHVVDAQPPPPPPPTVVAIAPAASTVDELNTEYPPGYSVWAVNASSQNRVLAVPPKFTTDMPLDFAFRTALLYFEVCVSWSWRWIYLTLCLQLGCSSFPPLKNVRNDPVWLEHGRSAQAKAMRRVCEFCCKSE